jgi:integrase
MKAIETVSSAADSKNMRQSHAPQFSKVLDGRKQPVRGLWLRGTRYYARLNVENPITGIKATRRVPLVDKDGAAVQTVARAVTELRRLQTQRADNTLPILQRTPKFADYAKHYLAVVGSGQGAKKASTLEKERAILGRWTDAIGQLRLDQIKRVHVNRFIEKRLKELDKDGKPKVGNRSVNLDNIILRVVMKRALSDGLIQRLPTEGLRPLQVTTPKRPLFSTADLEKLLTAALARKDDGGPVTRNGQEFSDYIRLMAFSGARRNEALGLQWGDVDFSNGQLHLRRQFTRRGIETLKNREERTVDFNAKLAAHLREMNMRHGNASIWLFPSPQRGSKDVPAKSFQGSLRLVRTKAGMPAVAFHDLRHHFISMAVMSGIDFMTIAAWVGHKDGGILIGKVYGHLSGEHRKAMAERLNFGPVVLDQCATQ